MANAINSLKFGDNTYTFTLPYGTCSTAAATAVKTVDVDNFSLETGARVAVKFTVTNSASSPTLNVESTGAKAIYYKGAAITASYLKANYVYEFVYDGTNWVLIGDIDTNSTYSAAGSSLGLVKSGGDVTISSGVITVNDDSHNHTIANIDNLQTSLDGKVPTTRTINGKALSSNITLSASDVGAADSSHSHNEYMTTTDPVGTGSFSLNRLADSTVGNCSVAVGSGTTASGSNSHAEGSNTTASGSNSHAEGSNTIASGVISHAEGSGTIASGRYAHAEGYGAFATTDSTASVEETDSEDAGYCTHAEGYGTVAYGTVSHAEGNGTRANGFYSHAEGWSTTTVADTYAAHAEGAYTTASGDFSHAEGYGTTASNFGSHAEGNGTMSSGITSHAEGFQTTASGNYSHSAGYNTTALNSQYVIGHYNGSSTAGSNSGTTGDAFIIGKGTSSSTSNAFRVTYTGKVYGNGSFGTSGADYAEFFEWADGNPNAEDRRGYFVTLDDEQIRIAESDDYILGIISALPAVIGNNDEDWRGRYILDDFGAFITEEFEYEEEIIDKETGKKKTITKIGTKYKENPDYDPTRPYIQREDRPEWDTVGMMGVLSVRDDGTCKVNGFCKVANGGIATASESGYRVIKRINENIVKVVFK